MNIACIHYSFIFFQFISKKYYTSPLQSDIIALAMKQCSALARQKAGTASCVFALLYLMCIFMHVLGWVMYNVYVYWRVRYEF